MRGTKAIAILAFVFCIVGFSGTAVQAKYPDKPIEFIVRFGPGGGADLYMRTMANIFQNKFGIKTYVTDLPGSNSLRAVNAFMSKPADGYTILNVDATIPLLEVLGQGKYTLEDYIFLARANRDQLAYCINAKDKRFRTIQDFIKYSKKKKVNISTMGIRSSGELAVRYANHLLGLNARNIGFAKSGKRRAAVLGGHVDADCENLSSMASNIDDGLLKPILILSDEKIKKYPNVPISSDIGLNFVWGQPRGWAVKAGTPKYIVKFLETKLLEGTKTPEYLKYLKSKSLYGHQVTSGDQYKKLLLDQRKMFKKIMHLFHIKTKG